MLPQPTCTVSTSLQLCVCSQGRDSMYDNIQGMGVDPRSIAQRIMEVLTCSHACMLGVHAPNTLLSTIAQ